MKKYIGLMVGVALALSPVVASAHAWSAPVSCVVPVLVETVTPPTGGGGLLPGSGPMAYGWKASEHSNYVPFGGNTGNGSTCPFQQGCMLPH